jgi:quinol monooxygenase YgiN
MTEMYAAIRGGKVKPGMQAEFAKRVQEGALPAMRKMKGFKAYYLIDTGNDTIMAVSMYTDRAVAEGSTQQLMPWIRENLGPLLASPPEASDGLVLVSHVE